jgi:hypothetical protein
MRAAGSTTSACATAHPGSARPCPPATTPHWDQFEPILTAPWSRLMPGSAEPDWTTLVYTPTLMASPRVVDRDLTDLNERMAWVMSGDPEDPKFHDRPHTASLYTELLLVDEADRLKVPALEQLRDHYDRSDIGLVLIGMPGLEKRLARYPQLYSRVGFVHEFRPLGAEELVFVLTRHWPDLGLDAPEDFTAREALATIARITGGNLRLTQRLMTQVERILEINELRTVTKEVIEAARESLVLGVL